MTNIHPKVSAAAVAGVAVTVAVAVLGAFGITVPNEVAAAATTLIAFVAGYFAPRDAMSA